MASSLSLQLKQSQSLAMSPQEMELMRLIAMNRLELSHFIAQEVEENPLLEVQSADEAAAADHEEASPHPAEASSEFDDGLVDSAMSRCGERLSDGLDADFANVFPDAPRPQRADAPELLGQWKSMPGASDGKDYDLEDFAYRKTPRETLIEQLPFALGAASDRLIAQHLIDQLDDAGYFRADLAETAEKLGVAVEDMERVLHVLQQFDPPGMFARTLGECFAIQLRARNRFDPAMEALIDNLELLARRDFASLKKICGVDEEDLIDMRAEIRKLDPKPGTSFEPRFSETITPDVVVGVARDGGWSVEPSSDALPRVLVKHDYAAELSRSCRKKGEQAYLKERLERANWLERSLGKRANTILKVATEIVRQQDAFLAHGVGHLRPLTLKTVADKINMHESTVSRVTSNKYMLTPRGVFGLKYFFTASIASADDGDAHSAESVRDRIRTMIDQESAEAVLSDDDIVDRLKKEGVDIARRTVAKYREAMNIPSSFPRRREKRALAKAKGI
ncbi:RNA polymerase sigma-54 factor [Sinorhizobium meliloti]|uniref:RNA polymerase factor sigma-54 n=1 Tax=Sinorhizobium TaxID=28105 RepID=UPI000483C1FE|nr:MULTISPECIES: RNA polymerase factor sigma-54 [Sinorhizobium]ASP51694.1 RNA polymerase sigma-54 factor [Sinorhizobium meliloti]MBO1959698.1 RNA polymerase factor sigma-54 [Sinorhizobium medicae]MBO1965218.1 RNA polymerase factor sigma-54 [Sinorhizobium medicae]MDE3829303.1 RNA polymerase factor sigma-54 [Sinorhizobium meliloti]MDE4577387.1 RNA polymerase factor sigma-54 [Sinorhizobium meliloti]